jgi:competence protein ComFC
LDFDSLHSIIRLQKHNPALTLYRLFWAAVDWIYPPYCPGCQKFGERWCADCIKQTPRMGSEICPVCGDISPGAELCSRCIACEQSFDALRSWGIFAGPLREAIHQLKYKRNIALGDSLSVHLHDKLNELAWPVDLICPVPLSSARMEERGYNQSAELARPLALAAHIPYRPKAIRRIRETRPQVGLNMNERKQNILDAFLAESKIVYDRSILIIDDVATTGSTISSCALAARQAGARKVYGLTLARATFQADLESSQGA